MNENAEASVLEAVEETREPLAPPAEELLPEQPVEPAPAAPAPKPERKQPLRKRLSLGIRIPMQILSFVVFLALMVGLTAGALVLDARSLTSSGGIKNILTAVMSLPAPHIAARQVAPALPAHPSARYAAILRDPQIPGDIQIPSDVELPSDFTDPDALAGWLTQMGKDMLGEDANIDEDAVKDFLENSTVTDYLADKAGSLADDVLNGTANTLITKEEIVNLVKDNKDLVKEHFGVEITDEHLVQVEQAAEKLIEEEKINEVLHEKVQEIVKSEEPVVGGMTVQDVLNIVNAVVSDSTLLTVALVCALLVGLLCLLNFYNIPGALSWTAWAAIIMGLILSAPIAALQLKPDILDMLGQDMAAVKPIAQSLVAVMAPVHYGLLIGGAVLFVIVTVWRIIRSSLYKKHFATA